MHLSSYTSSSSLRYVGTLLLAAFLVMAAAAAGVMLAKALGRETFANQALIDYQFAKIGSGEPPDIAFIGDSSLGNAIDVEQWRELSGDRALNLALTGGYGYAGSYNMLRRLSAWQKPKHVVVMQTGEMMQRAHSEDAYIMTAPGALASAFAFWRMSMSVQQVEEAWRWLLDVAKNGRPPVRRESIIVNDYVMQGPRRTHNPNKEGWTVASILPSKAEYLIAIGGFCRDNGIDCLYAHGPLTEPLCSKSAEYFAEVARIVTRAGLRMVQTMPICVPESEIGDGKDHIRPDLKAAYTRRYFEIIEPKLRR